MPAESGYVADMKRTELGKRFQAQIRRHAGKGFCTNDAGRGHFQNPIKHYETR
jgi:hypothetical protein